MKWIVSFTTLMVLAIPLACDPATPANQTSCTEYCDLNVSVCVGANAQYSNTLDCTNHCETFVGIPPGSPDDVEGNTIGCRLYHTSIANSTRPELHCPHSGPTGGNVCGSWCENYCHLAIRNCDGDNALFTSIGECLSDCAALPTNGQIGDRTGNTVQCRISYLIDAATEPPNTQATHCPQAAVVTTLDCNG